MPLTPQQVEAVAEAVYAKAVASTSNRVVARKGDDTDVAAVRKAVAKKLAKA